MRIMVTNMLCSMTVTTSSQKRMALFVLPVMEQQECGPYELRTLRQQVPPADGHMVECTGAEGLA
jgi:hypothetical protein